jgi:maltose alpha-D-glucosyltransferase/alpha-amylase
MQWTGDRNAGFSKADSQRLILPVIIDHEYHYQTVNVEAQERNRHSLLWWIRRLIALRKQFKAFGRGTMEFLSPNNPRVLAFVRSFGEERILVVANLSRFVQYVELDLSRFKGMAPVELFGHTRFPLIGDLPYLLTLGPHMFDWFSIEHPGGAPHPDVRAHEVPKIEVGESWDRFIRGEDRERLEAALPSYLPNCRWFRSKAMHLKSAKIADLMPVSDQAAGAYLTLIDVEFSDAESETYILPLAVADAHEAHQRRSHAPHSAIADIHFAGRNGEKEGLVYDATGDRAFALAMLETIERHRRLRGVVGEAVGGAVRDPRALAEGSAGEPRLLTAEQTNSSIAFGEQVIFKLFRRIESGVSPDLEIGRFLTERAGFTHVPPMAGWLEYRVGRAEPRTMGVLTGFVHNHGDAWEYTRRELNRYFERAATRNNLIEPPAGPLAALIDVETPDRAAADMIGAYIDMARLLGRRTAELHLALASDPDDPAFAPEPLSPFHVRSTYQSMRNLTGQTFRLLHERQALAPEDARNRIAWLLAHQDLVANTFDAILKRKMTVSRIRTHGDLHLGQVLYTGKDFVMIDFEGEPARSLTERRRKRPALRDVAGMLRSFHYAAYGTLLEEMRGGALGGRDFAAMEPWARLWRQWTSWAFLKEYLATAAGSPLAPRDKGELQVLLDAFVLDKAIYEIGYEMNNRPDWLSVPLNGIEQILTPAQTGA